MVDSPFVKSCQNMAIRVYMCDPSFIDLPLCCQTAKHIFNRNMGVFCF